MQRSQTLKSTFSNIHKVKAPSRFAQIFLRWAGFKQGPMEASASLILLWKRSRSLAISSQFPLRDACRANSQDRMTWTWITGENLTWNQKYSQVVWDTKHKHTKMIVQYVRNRSCAAPLEKSVAERWWFWGRPFPWLYGTLKGSAVRKCVAVSLNSHVTQHSHQLHRQH